MAVLLTVVFIVYGIVHFIMNSEPFKISEAYIRQNQQIRAEIGEVEKCHPWFPISIDPLDRSDHAQLTFDVVGVNKSTTEVSVILKRKAGRWQVVSASYKDRQDFVRPLVQEDRKSAEKTRETREPGKNLKK
jgi:hypothetical protein